VASASSPSGATLAGRLGIGVLALAANDPVGFNALDSNWEHYERAAVEHGNEPRRDAWRAVATMHLAETRERAMRDMEHGVLTLCGYFEGMSNSKMPWAGSAREALTQWTTDGFPNFGIATVGTPDDALATIDKLAEKSGGFGTFLFLAHNAADWAATKRSYELFAEYVIPACREMNAGREASIGWVGQNSGKFFGAMLEATQQAIDKYTRPSGGSAR
jgi:limonene 1,2-monooxygenase